MVMRFNFDKIFKYRSRIVESLITYMKNFIAKRRAILSKYSAKDETLVSAKTKDTLTHYFFTTTLVLNFLSSFFVNDLFHTNFVHGS